MPKAQRLGQKISGVGQRFGKIGQSVSKYGGWLSSDLDTLGQKISAGGAIAEGVGGAITSGVDIYSKGKGGDIVGAIGDVAGLAGKVKKVYQGGKALSKTI